MNVWKYFVSNCILSGKLAKNKLDFDAIFLIIKFGCYEEIFVAMNQPKMLTHTHTHRERKRETTYYS